MCVWLLNPQQPAAELFFGFDQMLLLRRGGDTVYFGSVRNHAKPMVSYLQRVSGSTLPMHVNPATWMLEVLSECDLPLLYSCTCRWLMSGDRLFALCALCVCRQTTPPPSVSRAWITPLSSWRVRNTRKRACSSPAVCACVPSDAVYVRSWQGYDGGCEPIECERRHGTGLL